MKIVLNALWKAVAGSPWLAVAMFALGAVKMEAQLPATTGTVPVDIPRTCYLFCYFIDNGQDGLHLAWSRDGYKWEALDDGKSYLKPAIGKEKIMRDPCLLLGPDGVFRMVWTDGWGGRSIGYASSKDLMTWSEQEAIPVMAAEPTARNCWAPEVHYDAASQQYLVFWSTTIPGRFPGTENAAESNYNHRVYLTTTKDFRTFTPTTLFFDPGYCCIDATIVPVNEKFYLIFKDEVLKPEPQKNLWLASSDKMTGPYDNITGPLPANPPKWVEGPTAITIGDDTIIYYDCYGKNHFGAIRSRDMRKWEDVTSRLSMPSGIRHGTVLEVPGDVIAKLLQAGSRTSAPPQ